MRACFEIFLCGVRGKKNEEAFFMCDARSSFSNALIMQDKSTKRRFFERSKKCERNTWRPKCIRSLKKRERDCSF